jgi:hypothetical protein
LRVPLLLLPVAVTARAFHDGWQVGDGHDVHIWSLNCHIGSERLHL